MAAERYDECDTALTALNEGFGKCYDSARNELTGMLVKADASQLDLNVFKGNESLFKFEEFRTNIVVRINRVPTPHEKLDKLDKKIADLETKLKLMKVQRKGLVEQLAIEGKVDMLTDKITAVFNRLK
jgi:hypothetical protein